MTSTTPTTVAARVGRSLAATALLTGIAIGTAAIGSTEGVWDIERFDNCMAPIVDSDREFTLEELESVERYCCKESGGVWGDNSGTGYNQCSAPPAEAENVPGAPTQTTSPPVLQNPGQASNPVLPTPRGPSSGTLGQP